MREGVIWPPDHDYGGALAELVDLINPDTDCFNRDDIAAAYQDRPEDQARLAGVLDQAIERGDIIADNSKANLFLTGQGAARVIDYIGLVHG